MMTHYDDDDFWCEVLLWFIVSDPITPVCALDIYNMSLIWYVPLIYYISRAWYVIHNISPACWTDVRYISNMSNIFPTYFTKIFVQYIFANRNLDISYITSMLTWCETAFALIYHQQFSSAPITRAALDICFLGRFFASLLFFVVIFGPVFWPCCSFSRPQFALNSFSRPQCGLNYH